eukprot:UN08112
MCRKRKIQCQITVRASVNTCCCFQAPLTARISI